MFGLICGLPFLMMFILGFKSTTFDIIIHKAYGTFTGYPKVENTFNCTPLWFLYSLFVVELLAIVSRHLFHERCDKILFLVGLLGVLASSLYDLPILPFNIFASLTATFFFSVGVMLRKSSIDPNSSMRIFLITLSAVFFLVFNHYSIENIDLSSSSIGKGVWVLFNILAAITGSYLIYEIAVKINTYEKFNFILTWLGINTMPIIAFDYYSNTFVRNVLKPINLNDLWYINFPFKLFVLVVIIMLIKRFQYLQDIIDGKGVRLA